MAAQHNLIVFLTESGQHQQARADLAKTRRLYRDLGERMNLVRLRWLEGKIAREEGVRPRLISAVRQDDRQGKISSSGLRARVPAGSGPDFG